MTRMPLTADPAVRPAETGGEGHAFENQSVTRVGQILALFQHGATELSSADVAERLDLNRTTAYRYLSSLVAAGLLARGRRRGSFVLGGLMLRLGILALDRTRVLSIAPPHLRELSAVTSSTAVLSIWASDDPMVAYVQDAPRQGALVTIRPGSRIGMATSQMAVFLAHHVDEAHVAARLDELPPAERARVEAAIYAVHRTGIGTALFPSGLFGAAAPVFDEYGLCATVGLIGADSSADLSEHSPLVAALRRTARAIGDELVATGGGAGALR
jgi:DNA-binding IclR family transcriptional regulator